MSTMPDRVVIVGVSAAGLSAAEALRRRGFDGTLTLIPRAAGGLRVMVRLPAELTGG